MPWNWMTVEVVPADRLVRPTLGPGSLTRAGALAEVQRTLDATQDLAPLAATWRRGAKDDTVYAGLVSWTIYEHDGADPYPAALAWLEDYADTLRSTGLAVTVAAGPGRRA